MKFCQTRTPSEVMLVLVFDSEPAVDQTAATISAYDLKETVGTSAMLFKESILQKQN